MDPSFFLRGLVYLVAAAIAAPLGKRLGLGAVLGYLVAGALIGPSLLGWVGSERAEVQHFAEFGVVLMLFVVGLELDLSKLWRLRGPIFGLGGLQVLLSTAVAALLIWAFDRAGGWRPALALGLIFALSSTAIVLQTLRERGLEQTVAGRQGFAVLLFQDLAVIPILALLPLLGPAGATAGSSGEAAVHGVGQAAAHTGEVGGHGVAPDAWMAHLPPWAQALAVLAAVALIVVGGRFGLTPWLRWVAKSGVPAAITITALALVIGVALLMDAVGLSPALGTFLAGVVLASSEFRHELEGDIEPFKELLLAVFFLAVGAGIDFALVAAEPLRIGLGVAGLIAAKAVVLGGLAWVWRFTRDQRLLFAAALAQGGEFAFVLLAFATERRILGQAKAAEAGVIVALSMAAAPLLVLLVQRALLPRLKGGEKAGGREADTDIPESPVLLAGFGRFGHPIARLLRGAGWTPTVLELDSDQVAFVRRIGAQVHYGDATRLGLLRAAGAERARILIIAIDDEEQCLGIVATCRQHFPRLQILARACSRNHALRLQRLGVEYFVEQLGSSLDCATAVMQHLGMGASRARQLAARFKEHELRGIARMAELADGDDDERYIDIARQHSRDLETLLANVPEPEGRNG